ncbi:MAG: hypothetical protein QOH93_3404, partial [Chloroflexia bacterium]|nr:hypothetical protein [Chloroflexia bacterium]
MRKVQLMILGVTLILLTSLVSVGATLYAMSLEPRVPASGVVAQAAQTALPSAVQPLVAPTVAASASSEAKVFRINPTLSQASYQVRETAFSPTGSTIAVGITHGIAGEILFDRSNVSNSRVGEILVDLSQLQSDTPDRDEIVRLGLLSTDLYPVASFKNAKISEVHVVENSSDAFNFTCKMTGDLNIRGATHPATWYVAAGFDNNNGKLTGVAH